MKIQLIQFDKKGDDRGSLTALEDDKNVPFNVKRVYYIYDTKPDVRRGFHAHKALEQLLICVSGSCKVLLDNGTEKETIELNDPNQGLLVGKMLWHEMFDFSSSCVLLVLANEWYQESDYIRDYDTFLAEV